MDKGICMNKGPGKDTTWEQNANKSLNFDTIEPTAGIVLFLPRSPNRVRILLCNLRSFNDRRVDWTRRSRFLETKYIHLV